MKNINDTTSNTPLFVWFALCLQELPVTHTTVLFCVPICRGYKERKDESFKECN